jgi:hypothetical protein
MTTDTNDCGPTTRTPEQELARLQGAYDALRRDRDMWERAVFALRAQVWATECSNRALLNMLPFAAGPAEAHMRVDCTKHGLRIGLSAEALEDLRAGNLAAWECVDGAVREAVKRRAEEG